MWKHGWCLKGKRENQAKKYFNRRKTKLSQFFFSQEKDKGKYIVWIDEKEDLNIPRRAIYIKGLSIIHRLINGASRARWSNTQDLMMHWCTHYLSSTLILSPSSTSGLLPLSHLSPQLRKCHPPPLISGNSPNQRLPPSASSSPSALLIYPQPQFAGLHKEHLRDRDAAPQQLQCPLLCITQLRHQLASISPPTMTATSWELGSALRAYAC